MNDMNEHELLVHDHSCSFVSFVSFHELFLHGFGHVSHTPVSVSRT